MCSKDVCTVYQNEDDLSGNVRDAIKSISKREGYVTYDVDVKFITEKGGNFLGKLYIIDIKGNTTKGEKETHLFMKHIISGENLQNILDLKRAYETEAFVYDELFNIFKELQDEAEIPNKERYRTAMGYEESDSEKTILENLCIKGYKNLNRFATMSLEVAESGVIQLAKWHAFSFIMEQKRPEFYKKLKSITSPIHFNDNWEVTTTKVFRFAAKCLDEEVKRKLNSLYPTFLRNWRRYYFDKSGMCCLCHGDFRLNNLMMKDVNNKLADLIVLDYQLIYYGRPITDFFYFIFSGTDRKFRQEHLNDLKDLYYNTMITFMRKFGISPEVYPKKVFECDYNDMLDYGLIIALYYMPFFLSSDDDVPDLGSTNLYELSFKMNDCFNERIQGVVDDYKEYGIL